MLAGHWMGFLRNGRRLLSSIPQHSYDHGTSTKKLIGSTIGQYLDNQAQIYGDVDALVVKHQNVRLSYSEFADKVDIVARNLLANGILPGVVKFLSTQSLPISSKICHRRPCWNLGTQLL
jgi:hypothetical protein